jgi:AraC-like DNA-binding protein
MVCLRCKIAVKEELTKLGLHPVTIELGEAEISDKISISQHDQLNTALLKLGLELIDDKRSILIQQIKTVIIELVHSSKAPLIIKFSEFLSQKLNHDYTYLANLFSEVQGSTIEKFYITHKIERVKELLIYDELNLTEISHLMNYSSVSHLSIQFKKVTGLTPTHFKKLKIKRRSLLESI